MTTMQSLGEKNFLRELIPHLKASSAFVNGFGHDASIMNVGLEKNIVFKIDRAAYPLALKNGWSDHKAWGHIAVTSNISDILATGATPCGFMVSIIVPSSYESSSVSNIVFGCVETCEKYNVSFLGGDTKEGTSPQVIGSAFGVIDKNNFLKRHVAKPGDRLIIAGEMGGFLGAYLQLKQFAKLPNNSTEMKEYISNPIAPYEEAMAITSSNIAYSSCDLSDGLSDAIKIFCGSEVGLVIDEKNLPLHKFASQASEILGIPRYKFAFGVGDWAIAYIVPDREFDSFINKFPNRMKLACIGKFTSSTHKLLSLSNGREISIPTVINEHFKSRLEDDGEYLKDIIC